MTRDLMRSLRHGQPWILMEQAPSAVNWRARNAPKAPGQMAAWSLAGGRARRRRHPVLPVAAVAPRRGEVPLGDGAARGHGAGASSARWRSWGASCSDLAPLTGQRVDADVAMLLDWSSWWALELEGRPSSELRLADALRAHYSPLWEATVAVDLRPPGADLDAYRLVVVPNLYLTSAAAAERLAAWVAGGGHVVMSYFSGIVDEEDAVGPGAYPAAYRDLLGLVVEDHWPLVPGESVALGRGGVATHWTEAIEPRGAEVLFRYEEGELAGRPAVTRHGFGDGVVTYLGTRPDAALMRGLTTTRAPPRECAPSCPMRRRASRRSGAAMCCSCSTTAPTRWRSHSRRRPRAWSTAPSGRAR